MAFQPSLRKKSAQTGQTTFPKHFVLSFGPQRTGSSWLDRYLRARGDVCLPIGVKEVFFFDRNYDLGMEFYCSHFKIGENHKNVMEISTTAFDHPDAPARVYESFGANVTLICPLRHPVDRSYSLYLHYLRYGKVSGTLQQACMQDPRILGSSQYAKHIAYWQKFFAPDSIGYLFQEELENDQVSYIRKVCDLLGLEFMPANGDIAEKYNVTAYSKSRSLAGWAQNTADFMRRHKLYGPINFAKSLGLKRMIFGNENADAGRVHIPAPDRAWLEQQLTGQVEALEKLIGPIPQWRR